MAARGRGSEPFATRHYPVATNEVATAPSDFEAFRAFSTRALSLSASVALGNLKAGRVRLGRWHPFGFLVFYLDPPDVYVPLRLHVWPPRQESDVPHSHAWHLGSLVLGGTYREVIFDHDTLGSERLSLAEVSYAGDGIARFRSRGKPLQFRMTTPQAFVPGGFHFVEAGQIHQSCANDGPMVTLVLTGKALTQPVTTMKSSVHVQRERTKLDASDLEYARTIAGKLGLFG